MAKRITFSADFTDEDIIIFATAKGWISEIYDENGDLVDNPISAADYSLNLAKDNMVVFLSTPSILTINAQKEAERQNELSALKDRVEQNIVGLITDID